jgi:hypothetical protein
VAGGPGAWAAGAVPAERPRECPTLTIDLERLGADAPALPAWAVEHASLLLHGLLRRVGPRWKILLPDLLRLRTGNRFHAEMSRYARAVGCSWRDVMIANVASELAIGRIGCSGALLATERGPVMARNMDFWPPDVLARAGARILYRRAGRPVMVVAGWPGAVAVVSGVTLRPGGNSFAIATHAAPVGSDIDLTGAPVGLSVRAILEDAANFDDAVRRVRTFRIGGPCIFALVGERNDQRAVVERAPRREAVITPDPARPDAPLVVTNHFRALPASDDARVPPLYRSSVPRMERIGECCAAWDPRHDPGDHALLDMLADPLVAQDFTAQHMVIRPWAAGAWNDGAAPGAPPHRHAPRVAQDAALDSVRVWMPARWAGDDHPRGAGAATPTL